LHVTVHFPVPMIDEPLEVNGSDSPSASVPVPEPPLLQFAELEDHPKGNVIEQLAPFVVAPGCEISAAVSDVSSGSPFGASVVGLVAHAAAKHSGATRESSRMDRVTSFS
jgi:hypothetical protein